MSKKFEYAIDLAKLKASPETALIFAELAGHKNVFERILNMGLSSVYPDGLSAFNTRRHSRILSQLDVATGNYIIVEESDFELINEAFASEKTKHPPENSRLIMQYRANIQKANLDSAPAVEESCVS